MKSVPGSLEVGSLYTLHDAQAQKHGSANKHVLECIQVITNDPTGFGRIKTNVVYYINGSFDFRKVVV